MEPHTHRRVETRLANLLSSRRLRFPYVDAETGDFKWKKRFSLVVLNTLGSCLNIPILFYLSFYILAIYPEMDMKPLDMISVTFFSAALSILVDVFMGYILDKFIKPVEGGRPNPGLRNMVCVLGTIGLVTMLAIFFRIDIDKEEAPRQFRASLMLILLFFTFANCNSFKNAINYSPFQEDRRKLLYLEYFLKGFIIFIYVSSPLWAKFFSDDCACGATCKARPNSDDCTDCIDKCDSFEGDNLNHFRVVSIVFTCIFGFANLISQFAIKTRNDEDREDIPTTYNRRLVELWNNKFLLKTFFVSLLEFSILFGFAIWVYYFAFNEIDISQSCLRTWGSSSYMCTRSYWLGLTVFLMFLLSALTFIVSLLWSFIIAISVAMSVLTFAAGILIITIPDGNTTQFCFIIIFMACFFASMAATKLVYSNGMYYDEYKSGVTQPNLPSCLFLLSVKLGFLLALALHLSLFYPQGFVRNAKHSNNKGFGAWVVVASFILLILKWRISKYDMKAFDKIQIAIERNINLQQDDIAFYDPIGKEPVRCPVTSFHTIEKKLIRLMYSLTPEDMMNVINGKQEKVQSRALTKMMIYIGVSVALLVVICVLGKYFDTPWGFLLSVAMLYLPVSIILILYEYNVWVAAGTLDSSKYKTVDRNILLRFILLLQPAH